MSDRPSAGLGRSDDTVLSAGLRKMSEGRDFGGLEALVETRGGATSRRRRRLALTFDDGPVLQTYDVLATLEAAGARGTFFLVGHRIAGHEPLIERILAGGHEIGNHSFAHTAYPPDADVLANSALLERLAEAPPRWYRPPFGAVDRPTADLARAHGMRVVIWSVDSDDGVPLWEGCPPEEVTANVLGRAVPGGIVLMHDGLPWSSAARALPELVRSLDAQGFELVGLSELLAEEEPASEGLGGRVLRRIRERRRPGVRGGHDDVHRELERLLGWMSAGLDPPGDPHPAAALIADACARLAAAEPAGSSVFAANVAAEDNDAIRALALGFSLRRAEAASSTPGEPSETVRRALAESPDPAAAAADLVRALGSPTRVERSVIRRQAAEGRSDPDPARLGAQPPFLELFGPGAAAWAEIEDWARRSCRDVAETRMREGLAAAGVGAELDVEPALERLDVDYRLRGGYVLGVCDELL